MKKMNKTKHVKSHDDELKICLDSRENLISPGFESGGIKNDRRLADFS